MSEWTIRSKNAQFYHSLIFGEQPKRIARFLSESLVFCKKMSEWAIRSKKRSIRSFAHFWWATWANRSIKKREWVNRSVFFKNIQKIGFKSKKLRESLVFCEQKSEWAIRSEKTRYSLIRWFIMSDQSKWANSQPCWNVWLPLIVASLATITWLKSTWQVTCTCPWRPTRPTPRRGAGRTRTTTHSAALTRSYSNQRFRPRYRKKG